MPKLTQAQIDYAIFEIHNKGRSLTEVGAELGVSGKHLHSSGVNLNWSNGNNRTCRNLNCRNLARRGAVFCSAACSPFGHLNEANGAPPTASAKAARSSIKAATERSAPFLPGKSRLIIDTLETKTTPKEKRESVNLQRQDTGETSNDQGLLERKSTEGFQSVSDEKEAEGGWISFEKETQPTSLELSSQISDEVELHTRNLLLSASKHLHDSIKHFHPKDLYGIRATAVLASELHKLLRLQFDILREAKKDRR